MAARIDWEALRAEYVSDVKSTYRSLSEKYGASVSSIAARSAGENWRGMRRKRCESVSERIIEERIRSDVESFAKVSSAACALIEQIELALKDKEQFYRYTVSSGEDAGEERISSKMDTRSLKDMAVSLREALEIFRRANRIPTVEQELNYDLAMKRFDLERERILSERDRDCAVQITFDDGIGELYAERSEEAR